MAIYIANINGDWWQHHEGDVLYVLDSKDIPSDVDSESIEGDKFENLITEYGKPLAIGVSNE